jgi:hypothetical protein
MFNLHGFKLNTRRTATALAAFAIGVFGFSGSASAAPLQLLPFIATSPAEQIRPAPQVAPPSRDEGTVVEMPARLKRQIVSYPAREAPGTVIIDTPKPGPAHNRSARKPNGLTGRLLPK